MAALPCALHLVTLPPNAPILAVQAGLARHRRQLLAPRQRLPLGPPQHRRLVLAPPPARPPLAPQPPPLAPPPAPACLVPPVRRRLARPAAPACLAPRSRCAVKHGRVGSACASSEPWCSNTQKMACLEPNIASPCLPLPALQKPATGFGFGAASTPAFGAASTPAFGASSTSLFGASSAPGECRRAALAGLARQPAAQEGAHSWPIVCALHACDPTTASPSPFSGTCLQLLAPQAPACLGLARRRRRSPLHPRRARRRQPLAPWCPRSLCRRPVWPPALTACCQSRPRCGWEPGGAAPLYMLWSSAWPSTAPLLS